MTKRTLGTSSLSVSKLCLGGNVFGWTVDEENSFKLLDQFKEAGGNFVDTADVYSTWIPGHSGGESETIIGNWMQLRKNREEMIIATKVGMEMGENKKGLSKKYILEAAEDSLRRLKTDYIDLYISHVSDSSTPIEETLEAYAELINSGKVRAIGASNYSSTELEEASQASLKRDLPTYQSLQPLYNLYDRQEFESTLMPLCEKLKVGVTPYYGLAAGFLTGKYRSEADFSKSPRGGGMAKYMNERGMKILKALDEAANTHSTSPTVIALAWLMDQPVVTAAIASARTPEQLSELIASTQIQLNPETLAELNKI